MRGTSSLLGAWTVTEDSAADPDVGGALADGGGKVGAHAHGKARKSIACRDFGEQGEVRVGHVLGGGNAHEAGNFQPVDIAALGDEGVGLLRQHARLLRFGAGVDLHEQPRPALLPAHLLGEGRGDLRAVDGVDHVEQGHGLPRLVGLERTDEVELHIAVALPEAGPFVPRLLHPVFAEHALAGL